MIGKHSNDACFLRHVSSLGMGDPADGDNDYIRKGRPMQNATWDLPSEVQRDRNGGSIPKAENKRLVMPSFASIFDSAGTNRDTSCPLIKRVPSVPSCEVFNLNVEDGRYGLRRNR